MAQQSTLDGVIHWLPWSPEVFERAAREDKLILLDSGATWCHWCHVMDRVTYEDPEVAELVNEKFLPVRIDRDRLPDIDAKYQRSPALISPQGNVGGWPLTVVLTPQGGTLMKAAFVPPRAERRFGAAVGLVDLLRQVDEQWRQNRSRIDEAGRELDRQLADFSAKAYSQPGRPGQEQIDAIYAGLRGEFAPHHGLTALKIEQNGRHKQIISPSIFILSGWAEGP